MFSSLKRQANDLNKDQFTIIGKYLIQVIQVKDV